MKVCQNGRRERRLAEFSTLTRLLPSQSQHRTVSGTRDLACHDLYEANELSVNPCRLDHNREVWRIYGPLCGIVGGPHRAYNLARASVDCLGPYGWMRTSSYPGSNTRLSNPWDHLYP